MQLTFTGTRKGVTTAQEQTLYNVLSSMRPFYDVLNDGDAIGADQTAKRIGDELGYLVVPYPAGDAPIERNHTMVDRSALLVACPAQDHEILRSGTWATIRYARKRCISVTIIWPDGTVKE
jgi:hypothetical protein